MPTLTCRGRDPNSFAQRKKAERAGTRDAGESVATGVERGDPISITDAELAGAFGINLDWSDGHRTGIYAWTYLREAFDADRLGSRIEP